MTKLKKVTVLIPCYNEEKGIRKVVDNFPVAELKRMGLSLEVMVIDNNSTDKTAKFARAAGATVIHEPKQGKGNAIATGFNNISSDTKYVVMLDGDGTYLAKEIIRMVEPLVNNFCHVVVGSRLSGKMKYGSLRFENRVANWFYTFLVRVFYKANVTDVLSGYFAWKKDALDFLKPHLSARGFAIEMDMITKMVRLGYEVYSVPITYDKREGITKLDGIRDGIRILGRFSKNMFWYPKDNKHKDLHKRMRMDGDVV